MQIAKATYKILALNRLIVQYYSGDITMDDIIYLQKGISDDLNYNSSFDVVIDFRDANLLLKVEDMDKSIDFFKNNPKIHGKRNAAYITNNPNEVVITTIFAELITYIPIQAKVFSTIQASVDWLGIDHQFLSLVLNDLKTQPNNN